MHTLTYVGGLTNQRFGSSSISKAFDSYGVVRILCFIELAGVI